jgi:hypothetical protein
MGTRESAAVVRWTGRGRFEDLVSTVRSALIADGIRGRVSAAGRSVVVKGENPAKVASALEHLPGVSWVAAGYAAKTVQGLASVTADLAARYLRGGGTFVVRAESESGPRSSDIAGAATSAVLDAVDGARVDEQSPGLVFRVAMDGGKGSSAVERARGPGGTPMGDSRAVCLVSGGKHSAVVSWMAALAGYSLDLVHVGSGEEALRSAAGVYAELSHRVDPKKLTFTVLEGGGSPGKVAGLPGGGKRAVFGGHHAECHRKSSIPAGVSSPLWLLPEETFDAVFADLHLVPEGVGSTLPDASKRGGHAAARRFGGRRADVHAVLDGLE